MPTCNLSGVTDYIETVLAILNEPGVILTDVKAEIDDFIKVETLCGLLWVLSLLVTFCYKRTEEAKKGAESDASSFDRLRQDINNYKKEIYDSFESANPDPEGRISSLELKIKQLKKKISRLQESVCSDWHPLTIGFEQGASFVP